MVCSASSEQDGSISTSQTASDAGLYSLTSSKPKEKPIYHYRQSSSCEERPVWRCAGQNNYHIYHPEFHPRHSSRSPNLPMHRELRFRKSSESREWPN